VTPIPAQIQEIELDVDACFVDVVAVINASAHPKCFCQIASLSLLTRA
jgi:hypothetical protein